MARFLSVESGGEIFAAALRDGEILRVRRETEAPHSRFALPAIESLAREAELTLSDLDFFAFAAGPGRFGGLRLACGIAQGLAYATRKPVVAVPSLEALAAPFAERARRIVAALPAYRGHVYFAAFERTADGELRTVCAPQTIPVERPPTPFSAAAADDGAKSLPLAVGAGFARYPGLAAAMGARVAEESAAGFAPQPDIVAVADLALELFARGESVAATAAAPVYARDKVALDIAERRAAAAA